jgi:hypothetical protein
MEQFFGFFVPNLRRSLRQKFVSGYLLSQRELGRQALSNPNTLRLLAIAQSVMEPTFTALPKLPVIRSKSVTSPMRRPGWIE